MTAPNRLALDGGRPQLATGATVAWPQFTSDDDVAVLRAARRAGVGAVTTIDRELVDRDLADRDLVDRAPVDRDLAGRRHGSGFDHRFGDVASARRLGSTGRSQLARLERVWTGLTGRSVVVGCASGEVAARLLAVGLELEAGDEVIVPAGAPLAPALASMGVVPVAVDVDPQSLHIDPRAAEAAFGANTRAVMAVDQFGTTADYRALAHITAQAGIALVEDGSASIGATFDRRPVGALGTTSVCILRNPGSGPALGTGALLATDDPGQAANAQRLLLTHDPLAGELTIGGVFPLGTASSPTSDHPPEPAHSLRAELSGPIPMSDLDAAVALERLEAIERDLAARSANGAHLRRALAEIPGIWMPEPVRGATHTYSSFPLVVVPDELGLPESTASVLRDTLVDCVTAEGLWIDAAQRRGQPAPGPRFPVLDAAVSGGLLVGDARSPLGAIDGTEHMNRIADCFVKILIDNIDRVRQLTIERAADRVT